ncbi:MAG: hypothetical protein AAF730_13135 [Bacteroidota bacterium]
MPLATIQITLTPDEREALALEKTMDAYSHAWDYAARIGRQIGTTSNMIIHRHCYVALRRTYGLSANLAIRAIARAARELKRLPDAEQRAAVPRGVDYDPRVCSLAPDLSTVSLSTVEGRLRHISAHVEDGERQLLLEHSWVRAMLQKASAGHYALHFEVDTEVDT